MRVSCVFAPFLLSIIGIPLSAAVPDYFPLQTGNQWVYRSSTGDELVISTGLPYFIGGNVYYRITGYAYEPKLVRQTAEGMLVALNEELSLEEPLTGFAPVAGGRYASRLTPCEQDAEPLERPAEYEGPAGRFASALAIRYRVFGCADTGIESEIYLASIGLLRRVVTTFAGPRTYELVRARVGKMSIDASAGVAVRLNLEKSPIVRRTSADPLALRGSLRVSVWQAEALKVRFPTTQRTDFIVRSEAGDVVFQWSEGRAFGQVATDELLSGERWWNLEAVIPGIADGRYTVEAWVTTAQSRILSATASLDLQSDIQPAR